jgi:hypothetical protein
MRPRDRMFKRSRKINVEMDKLYQESIVENDPVTEEIKKLLELMCNTEEKKQGTK